VLDPLPVVVVEVHRLFKRSSFKPTLQFDEFPAELVHFHAGLCCRRLGQNENPPVLLAEECGSRPFLVDPLGDLFRNFLALSKVFRRRTWRILPS
jgi:hypothetical protein